MPPKKLKVVYVCVCVCVVFSLFIKDLLFDKSLDKTI